MSVSKEQIAAWLQNLQTAICHELENADGTANFQKDAWERPGGGGGLSRVIQGEHIEKGGVNFSAVHGRTPARVAQMLHTNPDNDFFATGVSIVMHPSNPHVPIIHMNVRYFELTDGTYWFGGGIDLTPHYVVPADAVYFHQRMKAVCDRHDATYYPRFKEWADEYFYIRHRQESRGVGGIFFDRLTADATHPKAQLWAFLQEVGEAFAPIYTHFVNKYKHQPFTEEEKKWQYLRRGRYTEFNLVWDAGTKFGLETDGRTESILMSLPPTAQWVYDHQPAHGTKEADTLRHLQKGIAWL